MAKKRWRKGTQSSFYFLKEAGALENAEIRGALCFRATQIYKICPKKLLVYGDPFHPLFPRPCGRTDLLKEILKKVFNSITGFSNTECNKKNGPLTNICTPLRPFFQAFLKNF